MKTLQEYKAESTLNKVMRYDEGIMTRKAWIELMQSKGHFVKEAQEPAIQFDRLKFNRMCSYKEQEVYEKRCAEMKIAYRLYTAEREFYTITKAEFNYFNTLKN